MRLRALVPVAISCFAAALAADAPRPAPKLDLMTLEGETFSLSAKKGKVVLVKFFLTECQHCQRTAKALMPIYNEWRSRGLEVIGVAINPDAVQQVPEFKRRFGVTYPIARGDRSTLTTFADLSAVARFSVPYIFLIDRRGAIRYVHPGEDHAFYANESQNLRAQLDELLREQPAVTRRAARKASGN